MKHPLLIAGHKDLLLNINHTIDEVLKRHEKLQCVYLAQVPTYIYDAAIIAQTYQGMYKDLEVELVDFNSPNATTGKKCFSIGFTHYTSDELYKLTAVKDDTLIFFPSDYIVEILVGDIHYICRLTKSDLMKKCKELGFPTDLL